MDRRRGGEEALGLAFTGEGVFIVKLVNDKGDPSRIAGAVGFSVRANKIYVYKAKAVLLAAGAASTSSARARWAKPRPRLVPGVERRQHMRWPPRPAPS
ncbi:MAG: hypothetical protein U1F67_15920 [Rubrivivax sp.]